MQHALDIRLCEKGITHSKKLFAEPEKQNQRPLRVGAKWCEEQIPSFNFLGWELNREKGLLLLWNIFCSTYISVLAKFHICGTWELKSIWGLWRGKISVLVLVLSNHANTFSPGAI